MANLNAAAQKEIRRISLNRRTKIEAAKTATVKISSPIAKYDQDGNLHCIICKSVVKSASIWKVHINSANHKRNLETAKLLKDDLLKAQATVPVTTPKPKGILKNAEIQTPVSVQQKQNTLISVKKQKGEENDNKCVTLVQDNVESVQSKVSVEEILPENFFDVAKNSEKEKEALDEEWQRFKKEIKEESNVSHVIEASDHDHVAHDRQLEEIDEQMLCWYKVRNMEEKKEKIHKKPIKRNVEDQESESDDTENIDEFPDWRCKKYKK